jgi:hypothetical protein
MSRNKIKKVHGKSFKYEEVDYDIAYGKPVDDEGHIALAFHQGNQSEDYYGQTITKIADYTYSVSGVEGTFEDVKTAMASITMPGLVKGKVKSSPD